MGTLRQERWQDKDTNAARSKVRIIMQNMQMLGSTNAAAAGSTMDTTYSPSSSGVDLGSFSDDDDEVPF